MLFLIDLFWRLKQKYVFHFEFASKIDLWISGVNCWFSIYYN